MSGRRHPVGGQLHLAEVRDGRAGDVGHRLSDGKPHRGGGVEEGDGRAFAHGHGFAREHVVAGRGHGRIRDRHLPWSHHLVTRDEPGDRAVADGDEEGLVGHGGQAQHAVDGFAKVHAARREWPLRNPYPLHVAYHLRWLAEQHRERHVDGLVAEVSVTDHQLAVGRGGAEHGERAALASTDLGELLDLVGRDAEDVALLRFVAPDLEGGHAGLVVRNLAQLEVCAPVTVVHQLGQGVRKTARADVVNRNDGARLATSAAPVDDLLTAALHLRVVALDRCEIQVFFRCARRHGRRRATAEPDQHRGASQHGHGCPDGKLALLHQGQPDVAEASGDHDGLVVAADLGAACARDLHLESAEVAGDVGPAELVVEGRAADGALQHDVQRRCDARRLAEVLLPRLDGARQLQVRDRKAREPRLGLRPAPGGSLVADLAAGAGRGAGMGRDRRRVVVGFDFHQDADRLAVKGIDVGLGVGEEQSCGRAFDDGGVVAVGRQHAIWAGLGAAADHLEQRLRLCFAVDDEVGVEDLVAAVLAVGLREHHQLDVAGIAAERLEALHEVVDLIGRQRQPHGSIRGLDGLAASAEHVDGRERLRCRVVEEPRRLLLAVEHGFRHAVGDGVSQRGRIGHLARHRVPDAALDALDFGEAAVVRDVGRLGRPGRDCPDAWNDQPAQSGKAVCLGPGAVLQKAIEGSALVVGQGLVEVDQVDEFRGDFSNGRVVGLDLLEALGETGRGERWGSAEDEDLHDETAMKSCASGVGLQPGSTPQNALASIPLLRIGIRSHAVVRARTPMNQHNVWHQARMGWGAALLAIVFLGASGCIMPGQTPAIGEAAQMLGSCGPEGLIDDFEDNNNQAKTDGNRGGYWYTFADEVGTQVEPEAGGPFAPSPGGANDSKYAAHVKGKIASGSVVFGALGLNLTDPKGPYDASHYKAISFWAKKAPGSYGQVRFKVPDVSTDKEGGVCSECFNDFGAEINLTEAWHRYVFPFRKLRQLPDWGSPRPHMIKAHKLFGLQWQINKPGANIDFWVDDVEFLCE